MDNHQICTIEKVKNLVSTTEIKTVGDLQTADARAELIRFAIHLRKQGLTECTATGQSKLLRILWQRGAYLADPESVKETIANQKTWCPGRKENAVDAYTNLLLMHGMKWDPPLYHRVDKTPFIPTEKEINELIAGCGRKTATFLQLLKETAIRAGEAWQLEWKDIDAENRIVRVKPEKGKQSQGSKDFRETAGNAFRSTEEQQQGIWFLQPQWICSELQQTKEKNSIKASEPTNQPNIIPHIQTLESHNGIPQNQRPLLCHEIPGAQEHH